MGRYLNAAELDALKNYKYVSGLYGFIDRVIMTPFWNRVVLLLPTRMAPNLVTLLALLVMLSGTVIVGYHCPTLSEPVPSWALYYSAVCVFIYQTLDAIDGKQARRTGSSSPLGQLFDHGCDSISVSLMCLTVAAALNLGGSWLLMVTFCVHVVPFYGSNWEECQTGRMRFASVSVTEAQFLMIATLAFTGYAGTEFWSVHHFGFERKLLLVMLFAVGTGKGFVENLVFGFKSKDRSEHIYGQLGQFVVYMVLVSLWVLAPNHMLIAKHPYLCIGGCGCVFSYLINRLIISHVTHGSYSSFYPILYPLPLLVANLYLAEPIVDPVLASQVFVGFAALLYSHFVVSVIDEICTHLGIKAFIITPKTE